MPTEPWRRPRHVLVVVLTMALSLLAAAPRAQAGGGLVDPSRPSGTVTSSPQGFIGCVFKGTPPTYCLVAQVPSSGPKAGRLLLSSWVCTEGYDEYDTDSVVLPRSALHVSKDGSFSLVADDVPGMGNVAVAGRGHNFRQAAAASGDLVMFDWFQGFRLVSPRLGLTMYQASIPSAIGPPAPHMTMATVGGEWQTYLVGVAWSAPTSGQWDALQC